MRSPTVVEGRTENEAMRGGSNSEEQHCEPRGASRAGTFAGKHSSLRGSLVSPSSERVYETIMEMNLPYTS